MGICSSSDNFENYEKEQRIKCNSCSIKQSTQRKELEHSIRTLRRVSQMDIVCPLTFPEPVKKALQNFPNNTTQVMFNSEFQARSSRILFELGFSPQNTLFASSFCPDEINNLEGGLSDFMQKAWGEVFPMGGLSGIPFTGKGGFDAFSNHVPENGNLFVLFAPHVGITQDGKIGKFKRHGQNEESTTCGASLGALSLLKNGQTVADPDLNIQLQWIYDKLQPYLEEIQKSENQEIEVTKIMYKLCEEKITKIINTNFGTGKIAVCGGIQINSQGEDLFLPQYFKVHQRGQKTMDYLSQLPQENDMKRLQPSNVASQFQKYQQVADKIEVQSAQSCESLENVKSSKSTIGSV